MRLRVFGGRPKQEKRNLFPQFLPILSWFLDLTCLASQSPLREEREGVWSNAYRARISVHRTLRANQIQVSLSHDNRSIRKQRKVQRFSKTLQCGSDFQKTDVG